MITRSGLGRSTQLNPRSSNTFSRPRKASSDSRLDSASGQPSIATAPSRRASSTAATHERVGDPSASVLSPDEEAREKPDALVLDAFPTSQDLASSADSNGVPRPRTAGAPTDRLASHRGQDSHRRRVAGGHGFEAMPVAAAEPARGELAAGHAERHAPAVASTPLTLEQVRKIRQVSRPHGPGVDIGSHEWEATATTSGGASPT